MGRTPNPEVEALIERLSALTPQDQLTVLARFSAGLIGGAGDRLTEATGSGREETPTGADPVDSRPAATPPPPQRPGEWGYRDRSSLIGAWTHGSSEDKLVDAIRAARLPAREVDDWTA